MVDTVTKKKRYFLSSCLMIFNRPPCIKYKLCAVYGVNACIYAKSSIKLDSGK